MARIYVGNLPMDVRDRDLEEIFSKYGRIRDIDLKTPARPPAYAFVAFEDVRDAEDAVRGRDGYDMDGTRLRVEMARGGRGDRGMGRGMGPRGGGGGYPPYGGGPPMRGGGGGRQTEWRVIVTGLPPSASWQDLKDHMRKAGDVVYTDVDHRGGGIVHYGTRDDMEYALRKLDESEFSNPFDRGMIRVLPHRGGVGGRRGGGDSRSRSRSPRRGGGGGGRGGRRYSSSRSRSRSPRRRSRSRSPSSRSRSRDRRSRSRSNGRKDDNKEKEERAEKEEASSKPAEEPETAQENNED